MATHSSILAWEIPWTEEPAGLQSMGLQRSRQKEKMSSYSKKDEYLLSQWTLRVVQGRLSQEVRQSLDRCLGGCQP